MVFCIFYNEKGHLTLEKKDALTLAFLAAIWGGSFLFMRVAVPDFGPIALVQLRIGIAAIFLLPLLLLKHRRKINWQHLPHYLFLGITNSALPFCLLAYATVYLSAGYTSLLNSSVPLWSAVVAAVWMRDWLNSWQIAGLLLGFIGVCVLVAARGSLELSGPTLAIVAAVLATISYGVSANYTKRYLTGSHPIVLASMSQITAAIVLLPLTWFYWPTGTISQTSWVNVFLLGSVCTAFAYILFYGLIARVGPTKTVTVTFLVPVFAMSWGALILQEAITLPMIIGCIIILSGTALVTGIIGRKSL
ncbi:MAG: DMT family transporter [Hahellaceae bacterium]|nr:DMT family transporter [Hahellaceae bacterium]MCP5212291.1 DMT family transporter [Hahellaceae bacterium]